MLAEETWHIVDRIDGLFGEENGKYGSSHPAAHPDLNQYCNQPSVIGNHLSTPTYIPTPDL